MIGEGFLSDRNTQAAVERVITVLGEAANYPSPELRSAGPVDRPAEAGSGRHGG